MTRRYAIGSLPGLVMLLLVGAFSFGSLLAEEDVGGSAAHASAIGQLRAAWEMGQSEAATLEAIAELEKLAAEHPAAGQLLVRMLEDPRVTVRQAALSAAIRAEAVPNLRILPLISSLHYGSASDQAEAARLLGKFGAQAAPAVGALARAAQNESAHAAVRWQAVFALRDMGSPGITGLVEVLEHSERSVAYKALESLATFGEEAAPAYEAVVAALKSEDPRIRSLAAIVLGGLPEQAVAARPHLQQALSDPDAHVRDSAAAALERLYPR